MWLSLYSYLKNNLLILRNYCCVCDPMIRIILPFLCIIFLLSLLSYTNNDFLKVKNTCQLWIYIYSKFSRIHALLMLPVYLSLQIWKSFLGQSVSPILSNVCPQNICFVQTLQVGVAVPRVPVPALVHHLNQRLHPRHGRHLQIRPCVPVSLADFC